MHYDYNPEPDSGSPADRWHSLDSQVVEEMALIIDSYLTRFVTAISMMRRRPEMFEELLKSHPEAREAVNHYFWEGLRLQKNKFDWPDGHPMSQRKGDS